MDTGVDDISAAGNRLLRFTGDVTGGDFAFAVVSNLATADVADIDDMSPGIDQNEIKDNPGFAIDTGDIHAFNFETGSGSQIAQAGTYGIHALGNPLFGDDRSRLYVLNADGELFEVDPVAFTPSPALVTGPIPANGDAGWPGRSPTATPASARRSDTSRFHRGEGLLTAPAVPMTSAASTATSPSVGRAASAPRSTTGFQ
jgi:hypothetical protein